MKKLNYTYPTKVDNKNAGIEVRLQAEIRGDELFLLEQAQLDKIGPLEAWTALGSNVQINYSTHGLFRYFGKFPSTIATHLINEYTKIDGIVMDPMAGSGTTALECLLSKRNCKSYDVNPLSVLLAKVKTTQIDKNVLLETLNYIESNYRPLSANEFEWLPVGIKDVDHWFLPETQDSLRGLIFLIEEIKNDDVKDFFKICLASSIRTVSRATSQQGRLFLDVVTAQKDCLPTFIKKAKKAIDSVSSLPIKETDIEIGLHDACADFKLDKLNDLVIVHPPYFNSYKYSSVNSLELSWMKINHAVVRKEEVREFFKVGKAEKVDYYVEDMCKSLTNISKTIKVGGVMALMIGDTIIKGQYIPVTKMLLDSFCENNPTIHVEKVVLRVPKYTEASWTTSQRRTSEKVGVNLNDFIIIFRRG